MPTAMTRYNLVRLANGYLINPRDGTLTPEPASVWLDTNTGIIEHVAYDRRLPSVDASLEQYFRHVSASQDFTRELPERYRNCETYDLQGSVVSAGLIDIQINGCFGTDFSHWTDEDVLGRKGDEVYVDGLELAARGLWQTGVTSFLPTLISQTVQAYTNILPVLEAEASRRHSSILGYHLEGPLLSPAKPGCHPMENLQSAGAKKGERLAEIYGTHFLGPRTTDSIIRLITLAPELKGMMRATEVLSEAGFIVSIGHSSATTVQAVEAVRRGATMITHLFNAMPQLHHREPGILGLLGMTEESVQRPALSRLHRSQTVRSIAASRRSSSTVDWTRESSPSDEGEENQSPVSNTFNSASAHGVKHALSQLTSEQTQTIFKRPDWGVIADGIHVHPMALNMAYQAHPEGCILVTDAVQLMDPRLPNGVYPWRSEEHSITKVDDMITLTGTDTLAGAAVSLDKCVRNLARFANIPLERAIHHATAVPARSLGAETQRRKGTLCVGTDADICIWDRTTGTVLSTWKAGRQVFGELVAL